MSASPDTSPAAFARWPDRLVAAVVAATVALWLARFAPVGDVAARARLCANALLPIGAGGLLVLWAAPAARTLDPRVRRAWRLLAGALTAWWAAGVLWMLLGRPPLSAADAVQLIFFPLVLLGVFGFPAAALERGGRLRFWLDTCDRGAERRRRRLVLRGVAGDDARRRRPAEPRRQHALPGRRPRAAVRRVCCAAARHRRGHAPRARVGRRGTHLALRRGPAVLVAVDHRRVRRRRAHRPHVADRVYAARRRRVRAAARARRIRRERRGRRAPAPARSRQPAALRRRRAALRIPGDDDARRVGRACRRRAARRDGRHRARARAPGARDARERAPAPRARRARRGAPRRGALPLARAALVRRHRRRRRGRRGALREPIGRARAGPHAPRRRRRRRRCARSCTRTTSRAPRSRSPTRSRPTASRTRSQFRVRGRRRARGATSSASRPTCATTRGRRHRPQRCAT